MRTSRRRRRRRTSDGAIAAEGTAQKAQKGTAKRTARRGRSWERHSRRGRRGRAFQARADPARRHGGQAGQGTGAITSAASDEASRCARMASGERGSRRDAADAACRPTRAPLAQPCPPPQHAAWLPPVLEGVATTEPACTEHASSRAPANPAPVPTASSSGAHFRQQSCPPLASLLPNEEPHARCFRRGAAEHCSNQATGLRLAREPSLRF